MGGARKSVVPLAPYTAALLVRLSITSEIGPGIVEAELLVKVTVCAKRPGDSAHACGLD
jgi:hypothetical protein